MFALHAVSLDREDVDLLRRRIFIDGADDAVGDRGLGHGEGHRAGVFKIEAGVGREPVQELSVGRVSDPAVALNFGELTLAVRIFGQQQDDAKLAALVQ
jgi:hypothetical protein